MTSSELVMIVIIRSIMCQLSRLPVFTRNGEHAHFNVLLVVVRQQGIVKWVEIADNRFLINRFAF